MTLRTTATRPGQRWLALVAAVLALTLGAAAVALALVVDSGTHSVVVPDSGSSRLADPPLENAIVEYIGSDADNSSSGTGLFDPFVRLQGSPTEEGYNTDAAVEFQTKTGKWTHAIKANAIPIVDCDGLGSGTALCWELFVDINEGNNAKYVSLNEVEIWFTDSATLSGYPFTTTTTTFQVYDFSGEILIHDVNQGSGRGDLRYLVELANIDAWDSDTYFVLYSEWGTSTGASPDGKTWGSEGGFEEWKVRKTPNVSILKTADAVSVNAGSPIGFTVTVTNSGVADATGVTISDLLPSGTGVDWSIDSQNPAASCSISGSPPSETLTCGPLTLAANGGQLTVHVTSATTGASCKQYDNTATITAGGSGSSSASTTVNCAAIQILKQSTKTGNPLVTDPTPLNNADNAVFTVTPPVGSAFDVTDNGTGDEDSTYGEVCVSGLAPGTYTVTEKTAPAGYGSGNPGFDTSAVAATGTNCNGSHPTTANSAIFRNAPLGEFIINFNDLGSGETSAKIDCTGLTPTPNDATPTLHDDDTETYTNLPGGNPAIVYTCTISIDP